ncbi:hypothetical protein DFJ73DRAFT_923028, partial [Zopfochytrium polystomum]
PAAAAAAARRRRPLSDPCSSLLLRQRRTNATKRTERTHRDQRSSSPVAARIPNPLSSAVRSLPALFPPGAPASPPLQPPLLPPLFPSQPAMRRWAQRQSSRSVCLTPSPPASSAAEAAAHDRPPPQNHPSSPRPSVVRLTAASLAAAALLAIACLLAAPGPLGVVAPASALPNSRIAAAVAHPDSLRGDHAFNMDTLLKKFAAESGDDDEEDSDGDGAAAAAEDGEKKKEDGDGEDKTEAAPAEKPATTVDSEDVADLMGGASSDPAPKVGPKSDDDKKKKKDAAAGGDGDDDGDGAKPAKPADTPKPPAAKSDDGDDGDGEGGAPKAPPPTPAPKPDGDDDDGGETKKPAPKSDGDDSDGDDGAASAGASEPPKKKKEKPKNIGPLKELTRALESRVNELAAVAVTTYANVSETVKQISRETENLSGINLYYGTVNGQPTQVNSEGKPIGPLKSMSKQLENKIVDLSTKVLFMFADIKDLIKEMSRLTEQSTGYNPYYGTTSKWGPSGEFAQQALQKNLQKAKAAQQKKSASKPRPKKSKKPKAASRAVPKSTPKAATKPTASDDDSDDFDASDLAGFAPKSRSAVGKSSSSAWLGGGAGGDGGPTRSVWFRLVTPAGTPFRSHGVTRVRLPLDAIVDDLRDGVKAKYPVTFKGVMAASLVVRTGKPGEDSSIDPDEAVSDATSSGPLKADVSLNGMGLTRDAAVYVVVPEATVRMWEGGGAAESVLKSAITGALGVVPVPAAAAAATATPPANGGAAQPAEQQQAQQQEIDPATGLPVDPTAAGAGAAIDPATGLPVDPSAAGGAIDPNTGLPMDGSGGAVDPATGMPIDPATGMPMDPSQGGGAVDPATGMPMDPSQGGGGYGGYDPSMGGGGYDPSMGGGGYDPSMGGGGAYGFRSPRRYSNFRHSRGRR